MPVALLWGGAWWYYSLRYNEQLRVRSQVSELVAAAQAELERTQVPPRCTLRAPCDLPLARYEIDGAKAVTLVLKGGDLQERRVVVAPRTEAGKVVGWRCASDAPALLLPAACRNAL